MLSFIKIFLISRIISRNYCMNKNIIMLQYEKCCQRIKELERLIAGLPAGHLTCCKNGKYYNNYYRKNWDDIPEYIPKSRIDFAAQLALREYYELQLTQAQSTRDMLLEMLAILDRQQPVRQLSDRKKNIISDYYHPNQSPPAINQEGRIYRTLSGIMVRSKSEALIGDIYTDLGIKYEYEPELQIGAYTFNPDFKAIHPVTQSAIYHEHFGMMDDPEYAKKAKWKITGYTNNGYLPFVNIIYSFESLGNPFDVRKTRNLIEAAFM